MKRKKGKKTKTKTKQPGIPTLTQPKIQSSLSYIFYSYIFQYHTHQHITCVITTQYTLPEKISS